MITIVGIDPSLAATGICRITIDTETPLGDGLSDADHRKLTTVETTTVHSPRQIMDLPTATRNLPINRMRRVQQTRRAILDEVPTDATMALIETPFYNREQQQGAIMDRSWLWGTLVECLALAGIPVVHVSLQKVKHIATGKGSGAGTDKTGVAAGMVKLWGDLIDCRGDGEYDALSAATIGAIKARRQRLPIRVIERHLELVAGIDWSALDEANL